MRLESRNPSSASRPATTGAPKTTTPTKRMLGIVNCDNDVAEYEEWSDTGPFPVDCTHEAYKLGVNYIVYAMPH
jgi:hypothetical protein